MADNQNKLSNKEALRTIQNIVEYGYVDASAIHFQERLEQECCNYNDLLCILSQGRIKLPPEYDSQHKNWKYAVEGRTIQGDNATIWVAVVSKNKLKCITIIVERK